MAATTSKNENSMAAAFWHGERKSGEKIMAKKQRRVAAYQRVMAKKKRRNHRRRRKAKMAKKAKENSVSPRQYGGISEETWQATASGVKKKENWRQPKAKTAKTKRRGRQ